ncbi:hypothetical protein EDD85DRAFT_263254 [Armillaria nabsnona]|nr:hypothetical protein EDD85DRAFT_263254 [Armillaria nabsnona]
MSRGMGWTSGRRKAVTVTQSSHFFSSFHHDDRAQASLPILPSRECPQQVLPTRPVAAAADGNGCSWSEDPIPTDHDERISCARSYRKLRIPLHCWMSLSQSSSAVPRRLSEQAHHLRTEQARVSCRQDKNRRLRRRRCRWVCLQLVVSLRRRVRMAWRRRRQPRWADRCGIVVYRVGSFIATGTVILGPVAPLAAQKVFPVVRFRVRVMVHEAPEYRPLLRGFPIIVARLSKEGQQEPPIIFMSQSIQGWRVVWGLAGGIGLIVQE